MRDRCDGCMFWDELVGNGQGLCRRAPPVPVIDFTGAPGESEGRLFPVTRDDDWCGEFQPSREAWR